MGYHKKALLFTSLPCPVLHFLFSKTFAWGRSFINFNFGSSIEYVNNSHTTGTQSRFMLRSLWVIVNSNIDWYISVRNTLFITKIFWCALFWQWALRSNILLLLAGKIDYHYKTLQPHYGNNREVSREFIKWSSADVHIQSSASG